MDIINTIKDKLIEIKENLFDDTIKRTLACYKIGFFYIFFVGNVICPISTMLHTPQLLIWALSIITGFIFTSLIASSPVFTRDKIFIISRYTMIFSVVTSLLMFSTIYFFHIHIEPL